MTEATIGRALKRLGVTQQVFQKVLSEKYGLLLDQSTVNFYCNKIALLNKETSEIVRKCLSTEYGIIYQNGQWVVRK